MAGAMRKMGIYLGLVEDDDARAYGRYDARQSDDRYDDRRYGRFPEDGYDDAHLVGADDPRYDYYEEELPAPEPQVTPEPVALRRSGSTRNLGLAPAPGITPATRLSSPSGASAGGSGGAAAQVREPAVVVTPQPAPAPQPYRITTLHPRTYNEARQIGESFRDGMPVIMNLTEMDDADAKRLVDFAAGLSFGLRGSIERVTAKVFLLSPRDVDVTAEDKAKIREGGFFNQS
ncbi:cell division protein SepF [Trujillonella endophytica]|uniref:Cell division protein SepF n=1 Tax=Trujillonella endophytica TaxID=673521 RepID=A0A1H8U1V5_9ACTN|nr:cell division protein SepF [Trujillella endophytica]SEO97252.1 cell division inhibitor SepF [Trujillella endophytica]